MSISDILSLKTEHRDELKYRYELPKRSNILVWVHLSNEKHTKKILDGLEILPASFIVFWYIDEDNERKNVTFVEDHNKFDMTWLDAILWDCDDIKLEKVMEIWVVPLVNENSYLWKILQEFHPGRAEWNAYLFKKWSYWSAYYALVRYLENHNFPYDNRNLVKNVAWV